MAARSAARAWREEHPQQSPMSRTSMTGTKAPPATHPPLRVSSQSLDLFFHTYPDGAAHLFPSFHAGHYVFLSAANGIRIPFLEALSRDRYVKCSDMATTLVDDLSGKGRIFEAQFPSGEMHRVRDVMALRDLIFRALLTLFTTMSGRSRSHSPRQKEPNEASTRRRAHGESEEVSQSFLPPADDDSSPPRRFRRDDIAHRHGHIRSDEVAPTTTLARNVTADCAELQHQSRACAELQHQSHAKSRKEVSFSSRSSRPPRESPADDSAPPRQSLPSLQDRVAANSSSKVISVSPLSRASQRRGLEDSAAFPRRSVRETLPGARRSIRETLPGAPRPKHTSIVNRGVSKSILAPLRGPVSGELPRESNCDTVPGVRQQAHASGGNVVSSSDPPPKRVSLSPSEEEAIRNMASATLPHLPDDGDRLRASSSATAQMDASITAAPDATSPESVRLSSPTTLNATDVMCEDSGKIVRMAHSGNTRFFDILQSILGIFPKTPLPHRMKLAQWAVSQVHKANGRFVSNHAPSGKYQELDEQHAWCIAYVTLDNLASSSSTPSTDGVEQNENDDCHQSTVDDDQVQIIEEITGKLTKQDGSGTVKEVPSTTTSKDAATSSTSRPFWLSHRKTMSPVSVHENDILCGSSREGVLTTPNSGNVRFLGMVKSMLDVFHQVERPRKKDMAQWIVTIVCDAEPKGRFLGIHRLTGLFHELPLEKAWGKAYQTFVQMCCVKGLSLLPMDKTVEFRFGVKNKTEKTAGRNKRKQIECNSPPVTKEATEEGGEHTDMNESKRHRLDEQQLPRSKGKSGMHSKQALSRKSLDGIPDRKVMTGMRSEAVVSLKERDRTRKLKRTSERLAVIELPEP